MSTVDPWGDFDNLKVNVRHNTVDRLKQIIAGFNDECWTMLSKSGKKQDLIDRILNSLNEWRASSNVEKWNRARGVLYQVRNSGMWRGHTHSAPGTSSAPTTTSYPGAPPISRPYISTTPGSSNATRYDPFAPPPRNPTLPMTTPSHHPNATPSLPRHPIQFKPSPFFQVVQVVSDIIECPESSSSGDRRQKALLFSLSADQTAKLNSPDLKYQLRLYCTSSSYFNPGTSGLRFASNPCPIEFPPTCEIRVNQVQITASTKGMKKKPGTAPPAHLGNSVRMTTGHQNRVEMVYVNSQTNSNQPPPPKKYYMAVMLVHLTTVDQLIERVKKGKFRTRDDILAQRKHAAKIEDDDIVAGPQKTSLKCPLSYARISTPCRSSHCVHVQCFDALSWYSVNEQTTTWSCPVCEKSINHEDLIVDGYFNSILESTPDTVEDVIVEADGEWHTSDDRYASDTWKKTHKSVAPLVSPTPPSKRPATTTSSSPSVHIGDALTQSRSQRSGDVVVLDSEEEDEVKRELSPSRPGRAPMSGLPGTQVIDLTLDSDEEESTPSRSLGDKRKAEADPISPSEDIWKKTRLGDPPSAMTMTQTVNGNVNFTTSGVLVSGSNHGARRYGMNAPPLQHLPHSTQQFAPTPVTHIGPYTTPYYGQPSRVATPSSGPFGQVTHRTDYLKRFGNG